MIVFPCTDTDNKMAIKCNADENCSVFFSAHQGGHHKLHIFQSILFICILAYCLCPIIEWAAMNAKTLSCLSIIIWAKDDTKNVLSGQSIFTEGIIYVKYIDIKHISFLCWCFSFLEAQVFSYHSTEFILRGHRCQGMRKSTLYQNARYQSTLENHLSAIRT